jgi:hypothetical protein
VGRERGVRLRRALVGIVITIGLGLALTGCGDARSVAPTPSPAAVGGAALPARPPVPAEVTVSPTAAMTPVPRSYLGLSTEYWALPEWSPEMPLLERVLSLLEVRGGGPLMLRVGGDSADHSFWDPDAAPMPRWAFTLQPRWLDQARQLVRALGIKLILDLNLITDTPATAAQWARAAESRLPHGSIVAFEVGNEPDIYSRADWLAITAGSRFAGKPSAARSLPATLSAGDYATDFRAYARALALVAPHTVLAGPALANPVRHRRWVTTLIAGAGRSLGLVTVHRYPYTGCTGRRGSRSYATIGRLLSVAASAGMANALRPEVDAAHDAGLPLRLTELNSVNCGGRDGVSNSFATALWAPDALFALLRAGVDGVNLHVRADAINAPFAIGAGGLDARPLLYGLIMFARALGPRAQLLHLSDSHPKSLNLAAWAVRVGSDTLHVMLIDKGRRSVRVSLRLPATADATVQRLVAPSARSVAGVTLGGQTLAADGRWQGTAAQQTVTARPGGYTVVVRDESAALLTVRVRPGALGARAVSPPVLAPPATRARRRRGAGRAPGAA